MGRLLPLTREGRVEYKFSPGHFLLSLAGAYKAVINSQNGVYENCALVIDEINRGNATAIFGPVFQLLDRDPDGWSSYKVTLSELEYEQLLDLIGIVRFKSAASPGVFTYKFNGQHLEDVNTLLDKIRIENQQIALPPNFYLLSTMNTSETSVFYMDSAFKRRWEWQFVHPSGDMLRDEEILYTDSNSYEWRLFIDKVNRFIVDNARAIRSIDDKLIGYYFLNKAPVRYSDIQNKLMFFIWDSVFQRDKTPLEQLLSKSMDAASRISTFGEFSKNVRLFVKAINDLVI
jgi:5-methylcytosine-specific restriction endonuclease McrBC GTP-binding regulatory subunit McrB